MKDKAMINYTPVSDVSIDARASFISKTYAHVAAAILLFTVIEIWLFKTGRVVPLAQFILSFNWLLIIGALMLVGWARDPCRAQDGVEAAAISGAVPDSSSHRRSSSRRCC